MTTPLPSAHEPLPDDFQKQMPLGPGSIAGCKLRHKTQNFWADPTSDPPWLPEYFDYCAPIGTIAAATTPLPEPRCDCGCDLGYGDEGYSHLPFCSIHRTYHHILPAALAALPEKPEGLLVAVRGRKNDWQPTYCWPPIQRFIDGIYDFAYAVPAQSGQGQGKEYRVTCPHCLGQQKANGAVCLECNGIGYWMNPYPLSTQPEGGEKCADIIVPAAPASNATQPDSASNAAPANVPTVAGSGQGESEEDFRLLEEEHGQWADETFPNETQEQKIKHLQSEVKELLEAPTDQKEIADCFLLTINIARKAGVDILAAAREKFEICKKRVWEKRKDGTFGHVKPSAPSPPSTAGETGMEVDGSGQEEINPPLTAAVVAKSLKENGGQYMTEDLLMHARDLERQLAAATAEVRRMTDAFHERCRVHGETHRMATEMHALAESLHAKLAAMTAERDEVGKRLETIQTT